MTTTDLSAAELEARIAAGDIPYEISHANPDDPTQQIRSVLDDANVVYLNGRTVLCLVLSSADSGRTFMIDFTVTPTPGTTLTLRNPVDPTDYHSPFTSAAHLAALQDALVTDLAHPDRRRHVAAALDALSAAHAAYPGHQTAATKRLNEAAKVAACAAHTTTPAAYRAVEEALRGEYAGPVLPLADAIIAATSP